MVKYLELSQGACQLVAQLNLKVLSLEPADTGGKTFYMQSLKKIKNERSINIPPTAETTTGLRSMLMLLAEDAKMDKWKNVVKMKTSTSTSPLPAMCSTHQYTHKLGFVSQCKDNIRNKSVYVRGSPASVRTRLV